MIWRNIVINLKPLSIIKQISCFIVLLLAFFPNFANAERIDMEINVSLQKSENDLFLHIKLENHGKEEVKVPKHYLPWMSSESMRIFLVNATKNYNTTRQMFTIDDPGVDIVNIESGKSLEGKIDLRNYFPDLNIEGNKDELLFFWTYLLEPKNENQESKRFGGLVIFQDHQ